MAHLGVLKHLLVAATLPHEVIRLWVVAVARAAAAQGGRAAAVLGGTIVQQHILGAIGKRAGPNHVLWGCSLQGPGLGRGCR